MEIEESVAFFMLLRVPAWFQTDDILIRNSKSTRPSRDPKPKNSLFLIVITASSYRSYPEPLHSFPMASPNTNYPEGSPTFAPKINIQTHLFLVTGTRTLMHG